VSCSADPAPLPATEPRRAPGLPLSKYLDGYTGRPLWRPLALREGKCAN
jgi:hypothetical protein